MGRAQGSVDRVCTVCEQVHLDVVDGNVSVNCRELALKRALKGARGREGARVREGVEERKRGGERGRGDAGQRVCYWFAPLQREMYYHTTILQKYY